MKRSLLLLFVSFCFLSGKAQEIQTIVPAQVVEGNAFQIQYVSTIPNLLAHIGTPEFADMRLVSGPNYYRGNAMVNGKMQMVENVAYTVVPLKTGRLLIVGVEASLDDHHIRAKDVFINVAAQPKASFNAVSTYTDLELYAPASQKDLQGLIRDNLFVKTEVDKTSCYLGEPVVVSFKLYSRLQSTSEVVNAPSLYGFSVMDMVDVNESHPGVETLNGMVFNTSLLRKMQLYPTRTGRLVIDPIQLENEIEFEDTVHGGKSVAHKMIASDPVTIRVKPLPGKQPQSFSGAVGSFHISAGLDDATISTNQQGRLRVGISGKGNFIQLAAPAIHLPNAFEAFDPLVNDKLDKSSVPAQGSREYLVAFMVDSPGSYTIAPVKFSFFNDSTKRFETITTDSLKLKVSPAPEETGTTSTRRPSAGGKFTWGLLVAVLLLMAVAAVFFLRKKRNAVLPKTDTDENKHQPLELIISTGLTDKQACLEIQRMLKRIDRTKLSPEQKTELTSIAADCELLVYSHLDAGPKRKELEERTRRLLQQVNS